MKKAKQAITLDSPPGGKPHAYIAVAAKTGGRASDTKKERGKNLKEHERRTRNNKEVTSWKVTETSRNEFQDS